MENIDREPTREELEKIERENLIHNPLDEWQDLLSQIQK